MRLGDCGMACLSQAPRGSGRPGDQLFSSLPAFWPSGHLALRRSTVEQITLPLLRLRNLVRLLLADSPLLIGEDLSRFESTGIQIPSSANNRYRWPRSPADQEGVLPEPQQQCPDRRRIRRSTHSRWSERSEATAYLAKELLRDVYATRSVRTARRGLSEFYQQCTAAEVPELTRLARTISSWEREILGWHRTGLSNGATEATNLLIKKVKRVGHGFRNFGNYRLRLLLHCGVQWQTSPTARIRGRQPRFVA